MQNHTRAFVFSLSKPSYAGASAGATSEAGEIVMLGTSRADAELDLRVQGIVFCGGVSFRFVREIRRGRERLGRRVPDR